MPKAYTVNLKENVEEALSRARELAASNGWALEGDVETGRFSGSGIKGRYVVVEQTLTITVTDKPFLAPWSFIANGIRSIFS